MKRRQFIVAALSAAGAAVVGGVATLWRRSPVPANESASAAHPTINGVARFPARYVPTLTALFETILPEHAGSPGAKKAGVMGYIERELARPDMEGAYRSALRGAAQLDKLAREKVGTVFASATQEDREQVLAAMLAGEGGASRFSPPDFVRLMVSLTLEGTLGDPAHGGNLGQVGWRYVAYDMGPPRTCLMAHGESCH